MSSIIQGFEYDIFISYRQKDNKYDGWVTEFVSNLKGELDSTFKEEVSVYYDINLNDGLLETYNVNASLNQKLKCLILIPVISQTYCDPKSYAWQNEFVAFNGNARSDEFGMDIILSNGNVAKRILPVKIHDLNTEDRLLLENELGAPLNAVNFIYKEVGVNRPLRPSDNKYENQNKTDYRNQINKVANAVKEIIDSIKSPHPPDLKLSGVKKPERKIRNFRIIKTRIRAKLFIALASLILTVTVALSLNKFFFSNRSIKTTHINNITTNPVAYEWYKKAEFRLSIDKNDIDSSILFLRNAVEADPLFSLGHAKLSLAYSIRNFYFFNPDWGDSEKAFVEAERSLYIDPDLALGYYARAQCTWTFQNKFPHEKTIREYKKAISLDPKLDEAYSGLGMVYWHVGLMQESYDAFNKALQINPENKYASLYLIAWHFFTVNNADLEHGIESIMQTPDNLLSPILNSYRAIGLIDLDRPGEAENLLSDLMKIDSSDIFYNSAFAIILAKKGDRKGALQRIEWCERKRTNLKTGHFHHAIYNLAIAEALLGNNESSVDKLMWVADNGFPCYTYFRDDPLLISLHQFAPYNELLKKLKIQWEKFRRIAKD
jgi:tetratricopeptide (TPR) repeat protein